MHLSMSKIENIEGNIEMKIRKKNVRKIEELDITSKIKKQMKKAKLNFVH